MKFTQSEFMRIYKACVNATDKGSIREALKYIELRAADGYCVATALDGCVMCQIRVPCEGDGVVLLPPIRPPKCFMVEVEKVTGGNVKISYIDFNFKLIYAYELPEYEGAYLNWEPIMPYNRQGDRKIFCTAKQLRRALDSFPQTAYDALCISIPDDPIKPIALSNIDTQAIVLPVRVNGDHDDYALKNMCIKRAESTETTEG